MDGLGDSFIEGPLPPTPNLARRRATLVTCERSKDAQERADLLEMLGLIERHPHGHYVVVGQNLLPLPEYDGHGCPECVDHSTPERRLADNVEA